jgi:cytochrome c peroxidase
MKKYLLVTALVFAGLSVHAIAAEPISPIKLPVNINLGMAELGKKLFFDPRLSKSGFISCNSCHNLSMGGTDNLPTSIGDRWQQGDINSPTVLNSNLNIKQFWNGRVDSLKEQAALPIIEENEMASTHVLVVSILQTIPGYVREFKQVFGKDAIDIDLVTTAIAEFEKTLVTPNSRFDQWLLGKKDALTETEKQGYALFKDKGCVACHYGEAVGGNSFEKMGAVEPYKTSNPSEGRFEVTGKEADRFSFKVPTLRNIELTYPYFHDGAVNTLTEAVDIKGQLQLGKKTIK